MSQEADAQALLDRFLDELAEHEGADFEAFVAAHPAHAAELRRLFARWSAADARLEGALPEPVLDESFFRGTQLGPLTGAPASAPVAGAVVAGEYRLLRLLGQGGMGQVWEAEQLSLGRRVALKLLRPGRRDGLGTVRLAQEARAGGRLAHPGLVAVYAAGEADGTPYISQQLVGDGFTLADWIERRRATPTLDGRDYRELAALFAQVAEAVQAAHAAGVLHRDLKPGNILIGPDDRPQVTDFGLAHVADGSTPDARPGLLGTWPYLSPEQVAGGDITIDGRSDVFALGAVLYEALTQRRAFDGDAAEMIVKQVLEQDPPDPRRFRSRIPADLVVICQTALQKDRRQRYATMGGMAADLRRFLGNEPILARPQGWRTRAIKWTRRHPAWTAAVASLSVALAVILVLLVREVGLRRAAEHETLRADRNADLAALRAAAMHLDRGDHTAARRLLASVPEARRGWEGRHDALRADLSTRRLIGHAGAVHAVALSADGATLASAGADGTVRLWDAEAGRERIAATGHGTAVTALACSGDGSLIVSGGEDGRMLLWRADGASSPEELAHHSRRVDTLALSRDGTRLASVSADGVVRVHVLPGGPVQDVLTDPSAGPLSMALSADGRRLITAARSGRLIVLAWEDGGATILSDRYWPDRVVVAVGGTGTPVVTGAVDGFVLAWDPELAGPDVLPGTAGVTTFAGPSHPVSHIALSDDGRLLAWASAEANDVRLGRLPGGELQAVLSGHDPEILALAMAPDGSRIAVGTSDGTVLVWDGGTRGARVTAGRHEHPVSALAASADGSVIVSGSVPGGAARVWNARSGGLVAELPGHPIGVGAAAVSADGLRVVTAGYDKLVRLWDGRTGDAVSQLAGHDARVTSVAIDGPGRLVASGSRDRSARLWDAATGRPVVRLVDLGAAVTSVALDQAGRTWLVGTQDGALRLLRPPWTQHAWLREGTWNDDGQSALSADGGTAAWASANDDLLIVWDAATGVERRRLTGSRRGLDALALSPDGGSVLSAALGDDALRLRDTSSGETLALLYGYGAAAGALAIPADGRRFVSGGRDGEVAVFESELGSARALWRGLSEAP